jgi:hypothetical protein
VIKAIKCFMLAHQRLWPPWRVHFCLPPVLSSGERIMDESSSGHVITEAYRHRAPGCDHAVRLFDSYESEGAC